MRLYNGSSTSGDGNSKEGRSRRFLNRLRVDHTGWLKLFLTTHTATVIFLFTVTCIAVSVSLQVLLTPNKTSNNDATSSSFLVYNKYHASSVEDYVFGHFEDLSLTETNATLVKSACTMFKENNITANTTVYDDLHMYIKELRDYYHLVANFTNLTDIRYNITATDKSFCDNLQIHPDGIGKGVFGKSNQLSYVPATGYAEPLIPPLRHPAFCLDNEAGNWSFPHIVSMEYLVHDFAHMCRNTIQPNSRTIFIDLGASLRHHPTLDIYSVATIQLLELYRKFGIVFDHIYAYEIIEFKATDVYSKLPKEYHGAYHWINMPVSSDPDHYMNPLQLLLDNYNENDFIIFKLDIDTPEIEMALVNMILQNDKYSKLIDQFYFEHHVVLKDMLPWWGNAIDGSVAMSLQLFRTLRDKNIASHYWP